MLQLACDLFLGGRVAPSTVAGGSVDLLLAGLFAMAYVRTGSESIVPFR